MKLSDASHNIVVFLSGLIAIVIIGHPSFEWNSRYFVAHNPPLGLLFVLLFCVTFVGVGYFATRFPVSQSIFVVLLGSLIITVADYLPAIYPGRHYWPRVEIVGFIRTQLVPVAIACVLAYLGAWFRMRVNKRPGQTGDVTSR